MIYTLLGIMDFETGWDIIECVKARLLETRESLECLEILYVKW